MDGGSIPPSSTKSTPVRRSKLSTGLPQKTTQGVFLMGEHGFDKQSQVSGESSTVPDQRR